MGSPWLENGKVKYNYELLQRLFKINKNLIKISYLYFTAANNPDGIFRPAYTAYHTFNPNRRIRYWFSRAGADNRAYFNIKRMTATNDVMAVNYEMTRVPEAIAHSVYLYMLCRYNIYELHWVLNNCLDMVETCALFNPEKAIEYSMMKNEEFPKAVARPSPNPSNQHEEPEREEGEVFDDDDDDNEPDGLHVVQ